MGISRGGSACNFFRKLEERDATIVLCAARVEIAAVKVTVVIARRFLLPFLEKAMHLDYVGGMRINSTDMIVVELVDCAVAFIAISTMRENSHAAIRSDVNGPTTTWYSIA